MGNVDEIDICRSARLLIRAYGADAPRRAVIRSRELLQKGETLGSGVWLRIDAAARELLRTPSERDRLN